MIDTFTSKCLAILKLIFLTFILFSTTNLAVELFFAYISTASDGKDLLKRIYVTESSKTSFLRQHSEDIFEGYQKTDYIFSVGPIRDFSRAVSFNGATDGRRITSVESLNGKKYQGIMLGASQSWGYFVEDKHLVSQVLMNKIGDIAIDNYSLLGVTLEQSFLYWQSVERNLGHKSFVIVIGGVFDVINYCYIEPNTFNQNRQIIEKIGLVSFYTRLITKLNPVENLMYCNDSIDIHQAVQRVLNSIERIMLQAQKNNMKVLIVIPPVPLFGSPDVSNFSSDSSYLQMKKVMYPVYEALDKRINSLDSGSVINLMHAFDDGGIYFLDPNGHLTERGHEKLAEEIINQVGQDFFSTY